MTRAERYFDTKRKLDRLPAKKLKARAILEAKLKPLMTRQLAYENKIDRRKAA